MKVSELIEQLSKLDGDARVGIARMDGDDLTADELAEVTWDATGFGRCRVILESVYVLG